MTNVTLLEQPAFPAPSPPADVVGEVVQFRGRSHHRDRGCTSSSGVNNYGSCCPSCDWDAFTCAECGASEGEMPTDCPRAVMTHEQRDACLGGRLDYIQAAGGWVVPAPKK